LGIWSSYLADAAELIGVEAAGKSLESVSKPLQSAG
jgi:tryptophan synthase beta subunit